MFLGFVLTVSSTQMNYLQVGSLLRSNQTLVIFLEGQIFKYPIKVSPEAVRRRVWQQLKLLLQNLAFDEFQISFHNYVNFSIHQIEIGYLG